MINSIVQFTRDGPWVACEVFPKRSSHSLNIVNQIHGLQPHGIFNAYNNWSRSIAVYIQKHIIPKHADVYRTSQAEVI